MTIGIKVFHGTQPKTMQEQIDSWLEVVKPAEIISMAASESESDERDAEIWVSRVLYVAYRKSS
jgi:hypothetical protein